MFASTSSAGDPITEARGALDALRGEERGGWSTAALAQRVLELSEVVERAEAELARATGAWDAAKGWAEDGALSAPAWLRRRAPVNRGTAGRRVATARLARAHDDTGAALRAGEITTAHLESLARACAGPRSALYAEHEAGLLDSARRLAPVPFEKVARRWAVIADEHLARDNDGDPEPGNELHLSETFQGRGVLDASLEPGAHATVKACLDSLAKPEGEDDRRSRAERMGDALADLCDAAVRGRLAETLGPPPDDPDDDPAADHADGARRAATRSTRAVVRVTIDVDTLFGRAPSDWSRARTDVDGIGPVPPEVIRQALCDSPVARLLARHGSQILDYGFQRRLVSPAQRDALAVRDEGCVFEGCGRPPDWCDAHHLHPFRPDEARGPTDLDEVVLLCRRHHTLVHQNGWRLVRDVLTGEVTVHRHREGMVTAA